MSDEAGNDELPDIDEAVASEGGTPEVAGDEEKPLAATALPEPRSDLGLIMEVPLRLSVELGSANLPVRDVLELREGSVVELDRMDGEPADVYVNDRLIARGELDVKDDRVAIRITELLSGNARKEAS
ncbi:MAG: flagellar motor switch protein FliN [Myxococcota bacterium]